MIHRTGVVSVCSLLIAASIFGAEGPRSLQSDYGQLPLTFEANTGQTDPRVRFVARGSGYALFLTGDEAVLRLRGNDTAKSTVVRMRLVGATRSAVIGIDPQRGRSNYFIGNDRERWHSDVPTYGAVTYQQVYRGIDLIYRGNQRQLEYDFVIAPGSDPSRVQLAFDGIERLSIDGDGNLVLATAHGTITQHRPVVYQDIGGQRKAVDGKYVLRGKRRAGFQVGAYDKTRTLVIDPVLVYSTYLGGTGNDAGYAIAVDANGSAYVTGYTDSINSFPTAGPPYQGNGFGGTPDAFVAKLNPAGNALMYSTYLGGGATINCCGGTDFGLAIAVDSTGAAYITGNTDSDTFPTVGAIQLNYGGADDAFVTKLNAAGNALVYSTYLGGGSQDYGTAIAIDASGNAYVAGSTAHTNSPAFPTTAGVFLPSNPAGGPDAFVAKLNAAGSALVYSTFLGGDGHDQANAIAIDANGNAFIAGSTGSSSNAPFPTTPGAFQTVDKGSGYLMAFVTKMNPSGTALLYSTYLSGDNPLNNCGCADVAYGIAVDGAGNAYVTGQTNLQNFPTTAGAYQAPSPGGGDSDVFVTKFNAAGTTLLYSTLLRGTFAERGRAIAIDANGNAHVTGDTNSADFPTTADASQPSQFDYRRDAFVTKVNATGTALVYSTYLGGNGNDEGRGIALDGSGNAYVTGSAVSSNFPTVGPIQATNASTPGLTDVFVTKVSPKAATTTAVSSSVNPSAFGDSVTFTATVSGAGVTGSVQFKDGGVNLGAPVSLSGGAAAHTTSGLAQGSHSITAVYGGDANFYTSTSQPLTQVVNPPFGAPTGFTATLSPGMIAMVQLSWAAVSHADHYEVGRRSTITGAYTIVATSSGISAADFGVVTNNTYLYTVRAVDAAGVMSGWSSMDPATIVKFADDPLLAASTLIQAAHVAQLRTAVNAMRASANLSALTFADPAVGSVIALSPISQLRMGLHDARVALGLASPAYTDSLVAATTTVRAIHFQELRDRTK